MGEIYIGCSGWYYTEWKGIFYPDVLKEKDFFAFYANVFNTVEINSTFYHFPTEKTVHKWYVQAPKNFKYSLKIPRSITHYRDQDDTLETIKKFYGLSTILKEKTGCFLFQFPRSFIFSEKNLDIFLSFIDGDHKNVVEFRHPSWWNNGVVEALKAKSVTFCIVSGFPVPEDILSTTDRIYIRFHGDTSYKRAYRDQEIRSWATALQSHTEEWIYFNNTYKGHAPLNAMKMQEFLGK